jgi:hypothetical protein
MKKIAIINFTGFRGNWGCQATSFELLRFVANCFPKDEPLDFVCVPLLPTSRVDQRYDAEIDRVYDSFSAVSQKTGGAAAALRYLEEACVRRYGFWAKEVRNADLVVFQAEGSMGMGDSFAHGPRLMLLPFVAKHAWNCTVLSLNQSFYSHNPRIIQNAVEAFSSFDFTAFREGASVALARKSGVHNSAYLPDLAFMTEASSRPSRPALDPDKRYFAVSGSALKDPDRYDLILDQSRRIAEETGLEPVLAVSRDVLLTLKTLPFLSKQRFLHVPRAATYCEVAAILNQCEFLLGGRYHMSIIAAAVSTTSIFLPGNSFKNDGLVSLIDGKRPVRQFADTDGILLDARSILANRETERHDLGQQVGRIRAVIAKAQGMISGLVRGEPIGPLQDDLPAYDLPDDLLQRYAKFGHRKTRSKRLLPPGALVGKRNSAVDLLPPLLRGAPQSPATRDALRRLALADAQVFRALAASPDHTGIISGLFAP